MLLDQSEIVIRTSVSHEQRMIQFHFCWDERGHKNMSSPTQRYTNIYMHTPTYTCTFPHYLIAMDYWMNVHWRLDISTSLDDWRSASDDSPIHIRIILVKPAEQASVSPRLVIFENASAYRSCAVRTMTNGKNKGERGSGTKRCAKLTTCESFPVLHLYIIGYPSGFLDLSMGWIQPR